MNIASGAQRIKRWVFVAIKVLQAVEIFLDSLSGLDVHNEARG